MNNSGKELSKEELKNVSGGGCGKPKPKYKIGDKVYSYAPMSGMIMCITIVGINYYDTAVKSWKYDCTVEFEGQNIYKTILSEVYLANVH